MTSRIYWSERDGHKVALVDDTDSWGQERTFIVCPACQVPGPDQQCQKCQVTVCDLCILERRVNPDPESEDTTTERVCPECTKSTEL